MVLIFTCLWIFFFWESFTFAFFYFLIGKWLICSLVQVHYHLHVLRIIFSSSVGTFHYGDFAFPALYPLLCFSKIYWLGFLGSKFMKLQNVANALKSLATICLRPLSHQFCHSSTMNPAMFCSLPPHISNLLLW